MKLDNEQQEAANYINASSLIIAGAGSGKTTTLIEKINILVNSGINPREIAVISFTNKAVDNFKRKCTQNINITTFHKFALSFLDKNIEIVDEEELNQIETLNVETVTNNEILGTTIKIRHENDLISTYQSLSETTVIFLLLQALH